MAVLLGLQLVLLWRLFRVLPRMRAITTNEALVLAFVALCTLYCILAELLSRGGLFLPSVLLVTHTLVVGVLGVGCAYARCSARRGCAVAPEGLRDCQDSFQGKQRAGQIGVLCLAATLAAPTLLGAVFAPPNNWDSMTYHLPRVMHWLTQGTLEHYHTYTARQLYLNPGHEIILAHVIGLGGSDRYAGVLNSIAFFVAMAASASIVLRVGGSWFAQCAAVVVMGTIPMAILQASSTQNDLLHGLFLTSALLGVIMARQGVGILADFLLWPSVGLALLTKGLSLFWAPSIFLVAFPIRRYLSLSGMRTVAVGLVMILVINSGHWLRNLEAFGHPLGPTHGPLHLAQYSVENISLQSTFSNLVRTLALHSNIPFLDVSQRIREQVVELHSFLGINPDDVGTTLSRTTFAMAQPTRAHEDLAGNGGHLVLGFFALFVLLWGVIRGSRSVLVMGLPLLVTVCGLLVLCVMVRWQPWGSRLQLPLFMIAAPGIAALLSSGPRILFGIPLFAVLLLAARTYLFHNDIRPLLGPYSVVIVDDIIERYYGYPELRSEFQRVSQQVMETGCRRLGIVGSEDDWEQGIFVSLGLDVSVRSCKVPEKYGRYLWLAEQQMRRPTPCAVIWFGPDAPEKVGACGRGYKRVGPPQLLNVMLPRPQGLDGEPG